VGAEGEPAALQQVQVQLQEQEAQQQQRRLALLLALQTWSSTWADDHACGGQQPVAALTHDARPAPPWLRPAWPPKLRAQ
jgi:hypothetical protein